MMFNFLLAQDTAIDDSLKKAKTAAEAGGLNVSEAGLGGIILDGLTRFLSIVAIVALGAIIWGGVRYIISLGNDTDIQQAKKTIQWAVLGVIIVLMSFAILQAIRGAFGGSSSSGGSTAPVIDPATGLPTDPGSGAPITPGTGGRTGPAIGD